MPGMDMIVMTRVAVTETALKVHDMHFRHQIT